MMKYDVIIVGAGPSGIFTALEAKTLNPEKNILLIEAGRSIDKRSCPKEKTNVCVSCKPYCHITTGFSGAGAFSDGKLSLNYEVGGDLPELMGPKLVQEFINYTDKIYLDFGADTKVAPRLTPGGRQGCSRHHFVAADTLGCHPERSGRGSPK